MGHYTGAARRVIPAVTSALVKLLRSRIFVIILFLVHLIPVWYFDYLPLNDYPNHLARLHILRAYDHSGFYQENFAIEPFRGISPIPNLTLDIFVNGLMSAFDVDTALRVFLSLYIVLYLLGLYLLTKELRLDLSLILLVNIPLAFSFFFHLGVLGFLFSIPLFFLAVYFIERYEKSGSPWDILLMGLFPLLIYITHIISLFVLYFFLFCRYFTMRKRLKEYAYIVLAALPSMLLAANYFSSGARGALFRTTLKSKLQLVPITFSHLPHTLLIVSLVFLISAIILILKNAAFKRKFYLVMALLLFAGYLLVPVDGISGSFMFGRLFLYSFILLTLAMDPKAVRQVEVARLFLVVVCIINFSWLVQSSANFNRDFSTSCSEKIQERSIVMPVDITVTKSVMRPFKDSWGYFLKNREFLVYSLLSGIQQQIKYKSSPPDLNRFMHSQKQGDVEGPLRAIQESYDYVLLFGKDPKAEARLESISDKVCSDRLVSLFKTKKPASPVLHSTE